MFHRHLWASLSTNILPSILNRPSLTRQNQSVFLPAEEYCHNDQGTNEYPLSVCLESCLGASFMINAAYIVPHTQSSIMVRDRLNDYQYRQCAVSCILQKRSFSTAYIHPMGLLSTGKEDLDGKDERKP